MYNDIFSNKIFEIKAIDLIELDLPFNNKINYKTHEISKYDKDNIVDGNNNIATAKMIGITPPGLSLNGINVFTPP